MTSRTAILTRIRNLNQAYLLRPSLFGGRTFQSHLLRLGVLLALGFIWIFPVTRADETADVALLHKRIIELYGAHKYAEAIPLAERAFNSDEARWGSGHFNTVPSTAMLSLLYREVHNYAKAEPLYKRVLEIREKALGPEHADTILSLNSLASLYDEMGKYANAEPLFRRVLMIREKALGPQHHDTIQSLSTLAVLYRELGDFAKAEPLFQRALDINRKTLGPQHPDTVASVNNLAMLYNENGKYSKAEPLYRQALAIREKTLGPEHPDTATSLNNLGELYCEIGKYSKAEPLYQRALAIRKKTVGLEDPYTAKIFNNLGTLSWKLGQYSKSELFYQRALAINEKSLGPLHPEVARNLNNLAVLYHKMGRYAEAESLFQRVLSIREKLLGEHPETANSLHNLASLYQSTGDFAKAEVLYRRAIEIREKTLGFLHPAVASSLGSLALLYSDADDYAKAATLGLRALSINEKALGALHPATAWAADNLASLYESIGDYADAEPLFQRALEIREKSLGSEHPDTAHSLNNLAELYRRMGKFTSAEPLYRRALAICEKKLGPEHPDTAISLNNMAAFFVDTGSHAKAEPLYQRALAVDEKALGPLHPSVALDLNNLAVLYKETGEYAKAEPLYKRALAINEKALGPLHPRTAQALKNLAFLQMLLGRQSECLELSIRANNGDTANLANILSFTSEQQRLAFQQTADPYTVPGALGNAPEMFKTVLHNKGVVLDSLLEDRLVAEASHNAAHRNVIDKIRAAKQRLTRMLIEVPANLSSDALRRREREREALARDVEQLESGLAREVAGLGKARHALSVTIEQVQGALDPAQALVELLRYAGFLGDRKWETAYAALVLTSVGDPRWIPLGPAAEIEKNVRAYAEAVRSDSGKMRETQLPVLLRTLHQEIWEPIEKVLPPGVNTVVISPDADLNFVSFATLIGPDDRFLAEKYSVRYVASGRDLLREFKPSPNQSMVVFGNPDFGGEVKLAATRGATIANPDPVRAMEMRGFNRVVLPPLPGTASECAALKTQTESLGKPSEVFLGADATEAQLRKLVSPRILHLATHGFFLPEAKDAQAGKDPNGVAMPSFRAGSDNQERHVLLKNPMHRSGLALAGAQHTLDSWAKGDVPSADNDGIVTAEEVGGLNLQGTWLVTLSACDTGTGEARAGEGVMGLRRGFIQAGAQNLLMTLWPISDDTTVEIMKDFYARAFKTGNAPQSLAETQREWLVKLRKEKGIAEAVTLAGPFIMSSQGKP